jgi:hypothetical protein
MKKDHTGICKRGFISFKRLQLQIESNSATSHKRSCKSKHREDDRCVYCHKSGYWKSYLKPVPKPKDIDPNDTRAPNYYAGDCKEPKIECHEEFRPSAAVGGAENSIEESCHADTQLSENGENIVQEGISGKFRLQEGNDGGLEIVRQQNAKTRKIVNLRDLRSQLNQGLS